MASTVGFVSRRVRLFDLKRTELNGVDGEVICYDAPSDRWSVVVVQRDGSEIILRIREENLRRITRVWPHWPPASRSLTRRTDPIISSGLGVLSKIPDALLPNIFRYLDVFTLRQSALVRYVLSYFIHHLTTHQHVAFIPPIFPLQLFVSYPE